MNIQSIVVEYRIPHKGAIVSKRILVDVDSPNYYRKVKEKFHSLKESAEYRIGYRKVVEGWWEDAVIEMLENELIKREKGGEKI